MSSVIFRHKRFFCRFLQKTLSLNVRNLILLYTVRKRSIRRFKLSGESISEKKNDAGNSMSKTLIWYGLNYIFSTGLKGFSLIVYFQVLQDLCYDWILLKLVVYAMYRIFVFIVFGSYSNRCKFISKFIYQSLKVALGAVCRRKIAPVV